jgi:hypothetical protein
MVPLPLSPLWSITGSVIKLVVAKGKSKNNPAMNFSLSFFFFFFMFLAITAITAICITSSDQRILQNDPIQAPSSAAAADDDHPSSSLIKFAATSQTSLLA